MGRQSFAWHDSDPRQLNCGISRIGKPMTSDRGVLIWGGLGFLGQHMAARLLSRGAAVSILCRSRRLYPVPPWASRVRWFELEEGADKQATLLLAASAAS